MSTDRVTALARWEGAGDAPRVRSARTRPGAGRTWLAAWVLAVAWSLGTWLADGPVINAAGWPLVLDFFSAVLEPDLSAGFLARIGSATLTTLSFAVLGTLAAVTVGLVVGVLTSETWWAAEAGSRGHRAARRVGWLSARLALALPRGVHEAVWALLLLSVLGRDPLVGILAIAIPFGAITAKVYAEILDEVPSRPYRALREAGVGRLPALAYAVLPAAAPDLVSYAFYRFECAVRSAVILGMVGAGGLGFELALSFAGARHGEVWTLLFALVLVGAVVDRWGAGVRRVGAPVPGPVPARGSRRAATTGVVVVVLVAAALYHLGPGLGRLLSARTAEQAIALAADLVPPRLPDGGWGRLREQCLQTLQMSLVAATAAGLAAVAVAFVAARGGTTPVRRVSAAAARWVLLFTRSIPPPVWALLALYLFLPGPLPGALALAVYNFGILGRLCAEVVENLDRRPYDQLVAAGAAPVSAFGYGILPLAGGRFVSYGLYRWEVAMRETVVVGVVGAGGLGRLLEDQRVAFDIPAMAGTILALIALTALVDQVSAAVRRTLR